MKNRTADSEKAFNIFYLTYSKAMIRFINKIVHDLHKSEDLTHEVFIRFFKNGENCDIESVRTKNYLYTIAKNIAYDFIKRKRMEESKYKKVHFDDIKLNNNFYNDLDCSYIHGEIISTIHDTIEQFSGRKKIIAIERIFHNKKITTLSKKFDVSSYHIKKIEDEAYSEIRLKLMQLCHGLDYDPDSD